MESVLQRFVGRVGRSAFTLQHRCRNFMLRNRREEHMRLDGSRLVAVSVTALAVAACAGGDLDEAPDQIPVTPGDAESDSGGGPVDRQTGGNAGGVGPVTATADPGQAWVEVDGERIVFEASGSQHYTCEVQRNGFIIHYNLFEGHNLSFSASNQGDRWSGRVFFTSEGPGNVRYSAVLPGDGSLGLDEGAVSYEGTVERRQDVDPRTATDLDAKVAVNCDHGEANPTAVFGDRAITAPFSGAESLDCTVSANGHEVTVNRVGLDDKRISVEGRFDGESWLGSVSVSDGDDRYLSGIPADGAGLELDGTRVSYEGSFTHTSKSEPELEEEVEGTVSANCP